MLLWHVQEYVRVVMRQWPVLSDEHSCPVLTAALSKATLLPVCVCVHVCKCFCVWAPPRFRSSEAEGLTSVLPETAAPQPHGFRQHACPITVCPNRFCLRASVLVEFLISVTTRRTFLLKLACKFRAVATGRTGGGTAIPAWSTPWSLRGVSPLIFHGSGVQGHVKQQQIRAGDEKTTAKSSLSSLILPGQGN